MPAPVPSSPEHLRQIRDLEGDWAELFEIAQRNPMPALVAFTMGKVPAETMRILLGALREYETNVAALGDLLGPPRKVFNPLHPQARERVTPAG